MNIKKHVMFWILQQIHVTGQKNNKVLKDGNVSNTRNNSRRSSANNSSSTTRVVKSETLSKVNSLGITSQRPHSSKVSYISLYINMCIYTSKYFTLNQRTSLSMQIAVEC